MTASLQQLTCLTSARFRARAPGPLSGQLCSAPGGRAGHAGAGFLLPFGRRPSLLGASCPARGFRPSYDRPTAPPAGGADPSGVSMFRTRETRLAQGALCTPGAAVPTRPEFFPAAACRFSTASPVAPDCNPPRDVLLTRHQQGFTVIHPTPAFPSPVTPGGTGPLGFPLSFAPSRAGPGNARQGGDRPGHCPDYVSGISQPPSTYSLTTCDLTSQRAANLCSPLTSRADNEERAESAFANRAQELASRWVIGARLVGSRGPRRRMPVMSMDRLVLRHRPAHVLSPRSGAPRSAVPARIRSLRSDHCVADAR